MFCLYCGGRLPLLRDLSLGEFCSAEHREQFERLEHEFQEADPGHAPARCSLVAYRPAVMAPCTPRPLLRAGAQPVTVQVAFPADPIGVAGPARKVSSRLLPLKRKLSVTSSRPLPIARQPLWSAPAEAVIGTPHVLIADTLSGIAAAAAPPPRAAAPKPTMLRRLQATRWRPLAIAAALAGVAVLLLRMVQPAAHAAERRTDGGTWARVRQNISQRAAINMVDDFRTGLDSWKGRRDVSGWSYDSVGFIKPSTLAVYDPSVNLKDYTVEFLGQLRNRGMGVAVRAADLDNYYAVRLAVVHAGPMPVLQIVRYPVIDGREGRHVVKPLPLTIRPDTMFRGRILTRGDDFTLMIQDQVVDLWSDARLRRGGVGFFCQRGDDARLRWVEITHHDDTLGRLCALIAPYSVTGANGSWDE